MNPAFASAALAWLLTYTIHSSVLLGVAWLASRSRRVTPIAADVFWKVAVIGGIVTATIQQGIDVQSPTTIALSLGKVAPAGVSDPGVAASKRADVGITSHRSAARRTDGAAGQSATGTPAPSTTAPRSPAPMLLIGWAILAGLLALIYAARRLILFGRLGDRRTVIDHPLVQHLDELRQQVGFRDYVRLTWVGTISSPVALGTREICVPLLALSDLDADQQRSMLAHELAHLARRDAFWLDAVALIERIFFFQPLNRIARRELETAAEFLCDEWAARKTGSGVHLARCLAQVAEWIQAAPLGVPVAGMAEKRSLLVSRIARLLDGTADRAPRGRTGPVFAALLLIGGMIAIAPRVSGTVANDIRRLSDPSTEKDSSALPVSPEHPVQDPVQVGIVGLEPQPHTRPEGRSSANDSQPADTMVVNALIARLKDEDAKVRAAAARSLGRLEDGRAIPALIESLKDPVSDVRAQAADALSNFEDPRAIAPLEALLADASSDVKQTALNALSNFDHGVPVGPIIRVLTDSDPDMRHEAVHLLSHLEDRSAAPAIARLIHDPSSDVRVAVLEALANLGDTSAGAAVIEALRDSNADVRHEAMQAAGELKIAIPEVTLLAMMRDQNKDVRTAAAEIAGERSVVAAVPLLRQMLEDASSDVRETAVDALSNLADQSARDALRAALDSKDPKVRRAAAEALGQKP